MEHETRQIFVCDCGDIDHQFIVERWVDDSPEMAYLFFHVHLVPHGFWGRLAVAWRYVLGRKWRWVAFSEILLQRPEATRLRDAIDEFLAETNG